MAGPSVPLRPVPSVMGRAFKAARAASNSSGDNALFKMAVRTFLVSALLSAFKRRSPSLVRARCRAHNTAVSSDGEVAGRLRGNAKHRAGTVGVVGGRDGDLGIHQ